MLVTFLISFAAFTFLTFALIRARYRVGVRRDLVAAFEDSRGAA
jgi:hypothetical protein